MSAKLKLLPFREHKALREEYVNVHHFEKDYNQS